MVRALLVIFPFPSCQLPQNLSGHRISETSIPLIQMCLKSTYVFEKELREEEEGGRRGRRGCEHIVGQDLFP